MGDHALGEQAGEGLLHMEHPLVRQGAGDEAGVEQMQHRVLNAADILVHRHPVVRGRAVDRLFSAGIGETGEVPGRVDEGVEGVGLPVGRATTDRAGNIPPRLVARQRIAWAGEVHPFGQAHRQLVLRYGDDAAGLAMDHWDRTTPAPLTRDAPVAQSVDGRADADAQPFRLGHRRGLGGFDVEAVEEA
jgi:hypothetical protein